jgi:hypothetical protein
MKSTNGRKEKLDIYSNEASGTILEFGSVFKEASRNFPFIFLFKKAD